MPWAQLDDEFHSHPKFVLAGLEARGLYATALSYSACHLTDGFISAAWVTTITRRHQPINKLVDVHAWEVINAGTTVDMPTKDGNTVSVTAPSDGYMIHDYLLYNPSRADIEKKREERRRAGKQGADSRWGDSKSHGKSHSTSDSSSDGKSHGKNMATRAQATPAGRSGARPTPPLTTEEEPYSSSSSVPPTPTPSPADAAAPEGAASATRNGPTALEPDLEGMRHVAQIMRDALAKAQVEEADKRLGAEQA